MISYDDSCEQQTIKGRLGEAFCIYVWDLKGKVGEEGGGKREGRKDVFDKQKIEAAGA